MSYRRRMPSTIFACLKTWPSGYVFFFKKAVKRILKLHPDDRGKFVSSIVDHLCDDVNYRDLLRLMKMVTLSYGDKDAIRDLAFTFGIQELASKCDRYFCDLVLAAKHMHLELLDTVLSQNNGLINPYFVDRVIVSPEVLTFCLRYESFRRINETYMAIGLLRSCYRYGFNQAILDYALEMILRLDITPYCLLGDWEPFETASSSNLVYCEDTPEILQYLILKCPAEYLSGYSVSHIRFHGHTNQDIRDAIRLIHL